MRLTIHPDKKSLGHAMAQEGARLIREAIAKDGETTIIVATGASQFEMLDALVAEPDIDWSKVTAFHLDEYVGLPVSHGASFRRYLQERFVARLPTLGEFVEVAGDATDLKSEIKRLNDKLKVRTVSVCFAGIGENAHLAFNDPPADFETRDPYIVVNLDEACRKQQLGEGWFPSLDAVPKQAVSMSIRQIMASQHLLITVPDERKADAVQKAIEGPLTPHCPASILRLHPDCIIALDPPAASRLSVRL
jgi:glucosamine-6-phosphate deaminase